MHCVVRYPKTPKAYRSAIPSKIRDHVNGSQFAELERFHFLTFTLGLYVRTGKKKQCPYKCRRELARVIYTWMHKLLLQCFSPQLPDWNFLGLSSINLEDRTALVKIRSALSLKHSLFDRATVYGRKKSMQQVAALQMNSMHLVVWKHK